MKLLLALATTLLVAAPQWRLQTSGVTTRLRGVSAVSDRAAWASGSGSTVLRTADGGATWQKLTVTTDPLDFRDIDAIDPQTAYVLSIGNGPASRIYKTTDTGATWTLQFQNEDRRAFFDAMSFWDADHGIVIGDSIDGQFCIMTTENGGRIWTRVPASALPMALENEGAFAASGTNIAVFGKMDAWIGTGAAAKARVLRTHDRGHTWKIADTPLIAGPSAGIFSVAFRDGKHGVIVGGDYTKEKEASDNLAVTSDGRRYVDAGEGSLRLSLGRRVCAGLRTGFGRKDTDSGCDWSIRRGLLNGRWSYLDAARRSGFRHIELCSRPSHRLGRRRRREPWQADLRVAIT